MSSRRWLILIVLAGGMLRLFPIWFGLPYLRARPDEDMSIAIAYRMLSGDLHPRFFHWPSLTFYIFAALYWCACAIKGAFSLEAGLSQTEQIVIGRIFVACAGTATLAVVYSIGRRVRDDVTGLIAAALLAVAMLHVRESHFAMTDVIMTLLVTASLAVLLHGVDEQETARRVRLFAAAGFLGGLAASTKYTAAAVLAAVAAAHILALRRPWRTAVSWPVWQPSLAYALCFACGFGMATPYALLDFAAFKEGMLFNVRHMSEGHAVPLGRGFKYHPTYSLPYGMGPTAYAAGLAGVLVLAFRYRRHGFILLSFVAALYLSLGPGRTVFFRYVLPLVPVLCVAAAIAIRDAADWLGPQLRVSRTAAAGGLICVVGIPGLVNSIWFDSLLARTDSRVLAGWWLESRLQPTDTLYDDGGVYVVLDLSRAAFRRSLFDPASNSFSEGAAQTPEWLILYESPVKAYASTRLELRDLARREYELVQTVRATRGRQRSAVYDLQDAFFMPLWGFWTVERPGPTIRIYRRKAPFVMLQLELR